MCIRDSITTTKEITFPPLCLFPDADLNPASRQFLSAIRAFLSIRRGVYARFCVLLVLTRRRTHVRVRVLLLSWLERRVSNPAFMAPSRRDSRVCDSRVCYPATRFPRLQPPRLTRITRVPLYILSLPWFSPLYLSLSLTAFTRWFPGFRRSGFHYVFET